MVTKKISDRKGQVTMFIIIAVIIVAVAVLFYLLVSPPEVEIVFDETNPRGFIDLCIRDSVFDTVEVVSLQGGSLDPTPSYLWQDHNLQYLCYTTQEREPCITQIPFLREHVQSEIESEIAPEIANCFNSLRTEYERLNYNVVLQTGDFIVDVLPNRIAILPDYSLTVTRAGVTTTYDEFNIILNSNLYELLAIGQNILDWETRYGDANCDYYMDLYRNIRCVKPEKNTDATVYLLTDKETGEVFQFASRSLVLGAFR